SRRRRRAKAQRLCATGLRNDHRGGFGEVSVIGRRPEDSGRRQSGRALERPGERLCAQRFDQSKQVATEQSWLLSGGDDDSPRRGSSELGEIRRRPKGWAETYT